MLYYTGPTGIFHVLFENEGEATSCKFAPTYLNYEEMPQMMEISNSEGMG